MAFLSASPAQMVQRRAPHSPGFRLRLAAAAESGAGFPTPLACCWRPASAMPSPFMPVRSISMPWGGGRKRPDPESDPGASRSYFLQLVSQRPFVPVNERVITQFGKQWTQPGKMVSNGPYKLASWVVNERIEAERNPSTGMTPIPGSAGDLPAARFPAWGAAALRSREIQLTNKVALEYHQKTMQEAPERIWGLPLLGTYLYTFNLNLPELQDVRVRRRSPWPLIATC